MSSPSSGCVYIVGAGPGDPSLLTVKGAHCLRQADVLLYDELLNHRLLDLADPTCEKIYVGKQGGRRSHSQEEINALLLSKGSEGKKVVRLKGGDPCIYGRGAEEAMQLAAAGIRFEIVPGISAAAAVPAYAGIPLTHRGLAASAVLVTGHEDPNKPAPSIDWSQLAPLDSTLVIFMGVRKIGEIAQQLLAHGRPPATPVAAIERGTYPAQRTIVSDLVHIEEEMRVQKAESPALILIGEVVHLHQQLNWFESRPLFGKRLLVTRQREQAGPLVDLLEADGAEVSLLPLIDLQLPDDCSALDGAIDSLSSFSSILFTSPSAVDFFFSRLRQRSCDARAFAGCSIAAVGQATADQLRDRGIEPDLIPADQSQDGLIAAFAEIPVEGSQILFPASSLARSKLVEKLEQRGAQVTRITAYENRSPDPATLEIPPALAEEQLDAVLFASPSAVANFTAVLGEERTHRILSQVAIACIGKTTAHAVEEIGFTAAILPDESSIPALAQSIRAYFETTS
jgi:uroporphyrinogen III methyltransferase / synthase